MAARSNSHKFLYFFVCALNVLVFMCAEEKSFFRVHSSSNMSSFYKIEKANNTIYNSRWEHGYICSLIPFHPFNIFPFNFFPSVCFLPASSGAEEDFFRCCCCCSFFFFISICLVSTYIRMALCVQNICSDKLFYRRSVHSINFPFSQNSVYTELTV